jgi:hypothetical protein
MRDQTITACDHTKPIDAVRVGSQPVYQPLFKPTVFTVSYGPDGLDTVRFLPNLLVDGVSTALLTVEHLSLERFWAVIEQGIGLGAQEHDLMLEVPDDCGEFGKTLKGMDSGSKFRAELQRCHNAGADELRFLLLPKGARSYFGG